MLQCLDRPVENALGVVKIGGKIGESTFEFWPPNEVYLSFSVPNDRAKLHQILLKIATTAPTTDRQTDRHQRSCNLSHDMQ